MKNIAQYTEPATVAEIEVVYRSKAKASERKKIKSSSDAAKIFREAYPDGQIEYRELFYAMYLSRANEILAIQKISEGGTVSTVVDVKMIMQSALKTNSHGIILCHNHPSGALKPSETDIKLTKKLIQAGVILEIKITDHIILTEEHYYSFADNAMMNA